MSGQDPETPPAAVGGPKPQIGADEWVASHEGRRQLGGRLQRELERVPRPTFYLVFAIAAAILPVVTSDDYIVRVGFDTLLYMLLALGLNIVVGYAGLLDLGYVAFYGFGAYGYAMLASSQFNLHWPTPAILLVVTAATVLLGFLVALPSRRLVGDYLAIVTLFFGQLFVTVTNNGNRISVLGLTRGYDVTGGPNGIANVDPFHAFGHDLLAVRGYYYVALALFLLVLLLVDGWRMSPAAAGIVVTVMPLAAIVAGRFAGRPRMLR